MYATSYFLLILIGVGILYYIFFQFEKSRFEKDQKVKARSLFKLSSQ